MILVEQKYGEEMIRINIENRKEIEETAKSTKTPLFATALEMALKRRPIIPLTV